MTFIERLQQVIEELDGGNVSAFSRSCGLSNSTISAYLDGTSIPKIDKVARIAEVKAISLDWLVLGRGEMRMADLQDRHEQARYAVDKSLIPEEDLSSARELLDALPAMTGRISGIVSRVRESADKVDKALEVLDWHAPRAIANAFATLTFVYRIRPEHLLESLDMVKDVWEARDRH